MKNDKPTLPTIEVTPAMIQAGLSAVYSELTSWNDAEDAEIHSAIKACFLAMLKDCGASMFHVKRAQL